MKNNGIIFFCVIILIPYLSFSQMITHTYSSKFDTIGYIPPSFPGGYDSLFSSIEKSCRLDDSIKISETKINDALITFTLTEKGVITKYKNKGTKIAGITPTMEKCITNAAWTIGRSKDNKKVVESSVQINFTYKVIGNKIQYVQKAPIYIYHYDKKKKLSNSIVLSAGILMGAIFGGGFFYLFVD